MMTRSALILLLALASAPLAAQQVLSAPSPPPSELERRLAEENDLPTLQALEARATKLVLGLRDIADPPEGGAEFVVRIPVSPKPEEAPR